MVSKVLLQPQPGSAFRNCLGTTLGSHSHINHPLFAELAKPERQDSLLRLVALQGYQLTLKLGTTKNWATPSVGRCLTMRKLVLERDCPGQQIFPGEEGAIFRGAQIERDAAIALPETQNLINYRFC